MAAALVAQVFLGVGEGWGDVYLLLRLDGPWLCTMRGGSVQWYGGVLLNRMSLGRAWSSMELWELVYEPLRLLHTLSSDSVRYRVRLGDRVPCRGKKGRATMTYPD